MLNDSNIPVTSSLVMMSSQVGVLSNTIHDYEDYESTTNSSLLLLSSSSSPASFYDFDFDVYMAVRKVITWVSLLVACMGLLGNLFSFLVLINPKMRTTTNIFLANLCISSFIALVCLLINSIIYEITFYYGLEWIHHLIHVIYPYVYPVANTFQMSCIMLTVSVSFNQFLCIYFSRVRSYSKMSTMAEHKKTYYTVTGIYAFSIIYCTPYWLKFRYDSSTSSLRVTEIASNKHFNRIVYFWMYLPIAYIIPFSVLFFTNAYLLTKLLVAKQKRKSLGIIANINYHRSVSGGTAGGGAGTVVAGAAGDRNTNNNTVSQHASGINNRIASISNTTKSLITGRNKGLLRNNRRKSSSPNQLINVKKQITQSRANQMNLQLKDMSDDAGGVLVVNGGGGGVLPPRRVSVSSGSNNSSFQFHKDSSVRVKKRRLTTSNKLGRTKITCMLVVVVFFFFFCQFPNLIIHVLQSIHCADPTPPTTSDEASSSGGSSNSSGDYIDDDNGGGGGSSSTTTLHNKCGFLGLFNYGFVMSKFLIIVNLSFNFWCYCFFSEKFREVAGELITWKKCCCCWWSWPRRTKTTK